MAIIFNHLNFDNRPTWRRDGTNVDRDNLKRTMEGLGLEVAPYNDLTREELLKKVDEG
jgi:hypothetical protein